MNEIMDCVKYEFHKESMSELVELLKVAQEVKKDTVTKNVTNRIIEKYVPKVRIKSAFLFKLYMTCFRHLLE